MIPYGFSMPRTVSQVAQLAHVTVRTLHHYDEIGLLVPSERSAAGYRLYTDDDLARVGVAGVRGTARSLRARPWADQTAHPTPPR